MPPVEPLVAKTRPTTAPGGDLLITNSVSSVAGDAGGRAERIVADGSQKSKSDREKSIVPDGGVGDDPYQNRTDARSS